jgi:hypothetical protein
MVRRTEAIFSHTYERAGQGAAKAPALRAKELLTVQARAGIWR